MRAAKPVLFLPSQTAIEAHQLSAFLVETDHDAVVDDVDDVEEQRVVEDGRMEDSLDREK